MKISQVKEEITVEMKSIWEGMKVWANCQNCQSKSIKFLAKCVLGKNWGQSISLNKLEK